jgi:hypothetical protein
MRPPNCLGARFGETEVQHFSCPDQVFNGGSYVLDWHSWIDPVLVIKINAVGPETLK